MAKYNQSSFSRGVIAPEVQGRVDIRQYVTALNEARNCIVHKFGNISNRGGLKFIAPCKDMDHAPRLLPFQFKTTDTHIIEMGHQYFRILRNDGLILNSLSSTPSAVTQASPAVMTAIFTVIPTNGQWIYISSLPGMTSLEGQYYSVQVVAANQYALYDIYSGAAIDTSLLTAYSGGGTVYTVFELAHPYQQDELRNIKYVQTADVVTLVHPNHPPRELQRNAVDNWSLVDISFRPTILFPTALATSGGSLGVDAFYQVTAIDEDGNESLAGIDTIGADTITGITQANPAVVTTGGAHGLTSGDIVHLDGIVGMVELNTRRFTVNVLSGTTFELSSEDSSLYGAWISDGLVYATFIFNTNSTGVTVSWAGVTDAVRYRIFKKSQGVFGFIGSTEGFSFTDPGTITPDISDTPPRLFEPFLGVDNRPAAVGFHQQRMIFGGSNNAPDTTYYSVIGDFHNFTHSIPFQSDDSFSTTLASGEVNDIRHYVSAAKDLLALTSGEEWAIQRADSATGGFSIDTIEQVPQTTWGAAQPAPIAIDNTVLFVSAPGNNIRSTAFSFEHDHYVATDLTVLVPHLFEQLQIVEWAHSKAPDTFLYSVKDDGDATVLTYDEGQEVFAWTHWDTQGKYESVAAIQPTINESYEQAFFVVKRIINGNTVRLIERTVIRNTSDIRDAFFVDAGLSYDVPVSVTGVTLGNPVTITAPSHGFVNGDRIEFEDIEWATTLDTTGNTVIPDQLNDGRFIVQGATLNTFTITDQDSVNIDGTAFASYIEGGVVRKAVSTITGLFHLKNMSVMVLADGNVVPDITVSATGSITLPRRFCRIHIGLQYVSDIETLNIEFDPQGQTRTAQGSRKQITELCLKLYRTRGLFVGPDNAHLKEMKQREFEVYGEPTTPFTGDKEVHITPNWNLEGRVFLRQLYPLPLTVLGIVMEVDIGDS